MVKEFWLNLVNSLPLPGICGGWRFLWHWHLAKRSVAWVPRRTGPLFACPGEEKFCGGGGYVFGLSGNLADLA
jgi:hypothetical protein